MKKEGQVIRFGISDGDDLRATTWKLWTPSGKSDIYLAARPLGGSLKVSLHKSGSWHFAYNNLVFKELFDDPLAAPNGRFIEIWKCPEPLASGDILAFRIITPYSSVRSLKSTFDSMVKWIPNCPPSMATEVAILISPLARPTEGWPGKFSLGTKLIGSYGLNNDQIIWAVYRVVDMPDLSQTVKGNLKFFKNRGEDDLKGSDIRAIIFSKELDGSRVFYDCVVEQNHR